MKRMTGFEIAVIFITVIFAGMYLFCSICEYLDYTAVMEGTINGDTALYHQDSQKDFICFILTAFSGVAAFICERFWAKNKAVSVVVLLVCVLFIVLLVPGLVYRLPQQGLTAITA